MRTRYLRLHAQATVVNDATNTPMRLRDATACLIAMTATCWMGEGGKYAGDTRASLTNHPFKINLCCFTSSQVDSKCLLLC